MENVHSFSDDCRLLTQHMEEGGGRIAYGASWDTGYRLSVDRFGKCKYGDDGEENLGTHRRFLGLVEHMNDRGGFLWGMD